MSFKTFYGVLSNLLKFIWASGNNSTWFYGSLINIDTCYIFTKNKDDMCFLTIDVIPVRMHPVSKEQQRHELSKAIVF